MGEDKHWASRYLLDPLCAPEPSDETGPGTSFNRPTSQASSDKPLPPAPTTSQDVHLHRRQQSDRSNRDYPSPPNSVSPRREQFPSLTPFQRQSTVTADKLDQSNRSGNGRSSSTGVGEPVPGRRRGSSLGARFPGDQSHRPLNIIRHDTKLANRAPHLRKKHIPGTDTIDNLDNVGFAYHHEGPYDATLLSRNLSGPNSPIAAVQSTNAEALKATPRENIEDSLKKHRPLDGVALVPPGMTDLSGNRLEYEEGTDLMIENGGNYKRWPGVTYLPDDLKGKGEPSYSIEKALKEHKTHGHRRFMSEGAGSYEMTPRDRPASSGGYDASQNGGTLRTYKEWESDLRRSQSNRQSSTEGLKRRWGSLRRKKT